MGTWLAEMTHLYDSLESKLPEEASDVCGETVFVETSFLCAGKNKMRWGLHRVIPRHNPMIKRTTHES